MAGTVQKVIDREVKVFKGRLVGDGGVDMAMRDLAEAEERECARRRLEFQEVVQQARTKKRVEAELKEAKSKLAKVQKVHREVEGALEAKTAIKAYTAEMFGQGQKKGGNATHRKQRKDALKRVRALGSLSIEQENDWELFVSKWDEVMASTHGEAWGTLFAETLAHIVSELDSGKSNALSNFMHSESLRVLSSVPVIRIPGFGR